VSLLLNGTPLADDPRQPVVDPLFTPFTIHRLTLANRIVMAPMTRAFSPGGVPGPDVAAYYRRRAEHGVGLIVTEGTVIPHPAAPSDPAVRAFTARTRWPAGRACWTRCTGPAAASCRSSGTSG
jgi:2,4-dienoyl-CoA reductase-like NADH-dependent reductase (Old Yellow Enzyme family)